MDPYEHLKTARSLANLLDSKWSFLGIHFGIDPLFDLIPGITPLISTAISAYIIYVGKLFNIPATIMMHMIGNIVLDYIIGSIPLVGFIGDIFFKSNQKNLALIEVFLQSKKADQIIEGEIVQ